MHLRSVEKLELSFLNTFLAFGCARSHSVCAHEIIGVVV